MNLTTQPYKGTSDWLPVKYKVQKYIFDTWRSVCLKFGYKEYLTPLIEYADLYRAKSGEVKEELFTLQDRAGRDLALRPEMTPSVTRMVASIYQSEPKPIRLFSIAPFYRNEAPQRGRTREFWQLNADIFGDKTINSDIEILSLAIEIMLAFNAPKDSFKLFFSSRVLIDDFFAELDLPKEKAQIVARIMDKFDKIEVEKFKGMLEKEGIEQAKILSIVDFLKGNYVNASSQGLEDIRYISESLYKLGYGDYAEFKPSVVRGFEYYDGTIFEVFDLNPQNNRSMFGGGRYNGLAEIFGVDKFPATGFAPGNITTELFLESWNLLPNLDEKELYYFPTLIENSYVKTIKLANKLRNKGLKVITGFELQTISDSLREANKIKAKYVIILGEDELKKDNISIKNMLSGEQQTKPLETFLSEIS